MSNLMGRLICSSRQQLRPQAAAVVRKFPDTAVYLEPCRFVRQIQKRRAFGLPGTKTTFEDVPGDRFYLTGERERVEEAAAQLIRELELTQPGRGSLIVQNLEADTTEKTPPAAGSFAQITFILSSPGAGDAVAELALALGAGLPSVTLGVGTGIRDRLGLLRITIAPEKELVHLVVPYHDADGIVQLLIESGRLDRPGGGFVYQVPVLSAQLDTRMRIGIQEHAASIEQIIAAMDELRGDTTWRKRFVSGSRRRYAYNRRMREITVYSQEGYSAELVSRATAAGAGGATIAKVQKLCAEPEESRETAAWERIIILAAQQRTNAVVGALKQYREEQPLLCGDAELLSAPLAYSYHRKGGAGKSGNRKEHG
jgi:hypothetical protein